MRIAKLLPAMLLLVVVLPVAGCMSPATNFRVSSLPEGLKVELLGYRFLMRGVHELEVSVRNVGEGMLYRLNDHEIVVITGREIRLDGETLDMDSGELRVIQSGGGLEEGEGRARRRAGEKELLQPTP